MGKTKSEALFERFLSTNGICFRPLPTGPTKSPDYEVTIAGTELVFEVKELADNQSFEKASVHSRTVGAHIRKKISDRRTMKQIQSASEQGKPTILLIFNNLDQLQLYGTENHDFENAMYGEHTVVIDTNNRKIIGSFHGHKKSFQQSKNTSFSALGRLKRSHNSISVTLFENVHAKVGIDYEVLPACFEVIRFQKAA